MHKRLAWICIKSDLAREALQRYLRVDAHSLTGLDKDGIPATACLTHVLCAAYYVSLFF